MPIKFSTSFDEFVEIAEYPGQYILPLRLFSRLWYNSRTKYRERRRAYETSSGPDAGAVSAAVRLPPLPHLEGAAPARRRPRERRDAGSRRLRRIRRHPPLLRDALRIPGRGRPAGDLRDRPGHGRRGRRRRRADGRPGPELRGLRRLLYPRFHRHDPLRRRPDRRLLGGRIRPLRAPDPPGGAVVQPDACRLRRKSHAARHGAQRLLCPRRAGLL